MKYSNYTKRQYGLTMVEVMVALAISLVLLAGIGQIYISNKQTYRTTDAVSRMQENGRFAINFIAQSMRASDYWGCLGRFNEVANPGLISADVDADGTDESSTNFSAGLSAMDNASVTGLVATDTIRLISASQDSISVNSAAAGTAIIALDNAADFSAGEEILINNCEYAQLATISSIAGNSLTLTSNLFRSYATDATVHKLITTTYGLGVNAAGNPILMSNGIELVEGVENMQISFGADTDGDRVANYYVAPGTAGLDMNNVISAKMTLTVRTLDDGIAFQSRVYNGVSDRRIAKNYTATFAIRNRLN